MDMLSSFIMPIVNNYDDLYDIVSNCKIKKENIIEKISRSINFDAVKLKDDVDIIGKYPLIICKYDGKVSLIRYIPTVLSENNTEILDIENNTKLTENINPEKISDAHILYENYKVDKNFDIKEILKFVNKPLSRLNIEITIINFLGSFLKSGLFVLNYYILREIVPNGKMDDFLTVFILILAFIFSSILVSIFVNYSNLYIDFTKKTREEIVNISVLWSFSLKTLINTNRAELLYLSRSVSEISILKSELITKISTLVVFLPMMFITAIRVPFLLFIFTTLFSIICGLYVYFINVKNIKDSQSLNESAIKEKELIFNLINSYKRLNFYKTVKHNVDKLKLITLNNFNAKYNGRVINETSTQVEESLLDILKVIIMASFIITITLAGPNSNTTIVSVFIVYHLLTNVYNFFPNVGKILSEYKKISYLNDKNIERIVSNMENKNETTQITNPEITIRINDFSLPYDCKFDAGDKIDLLIKGKKFIQITGDSGTGKSTFVKCLLGIEKVYSGKIEVLGVNPINFTEEDRRRTFTYVDQNSNLIYGTLRDNLTLLVKKSIDNKEIMKIAEKLLLADLINNLPLGLDTPITNETSSFSTGEKQRIIIAQAILKGGDILILDEALTGISAADENIIVEYLRSIFTQVIIISHRMNLLDKADLVIKMRNSDD